MMNKRDLKADLELCNKATPGPWEVFPPLCGPEGQTVYQVDSGGPICDVSDPYPRGDNKPQENMMFIAQAREGWPHAIERALKAEALAQKLLDVLGRVIPNYLVGRLELDLDSVLEATVVRGEWTTNSDYPDTVICSICGWKESVWWADKGTNYCPNCGAKMEVK